MQNVLCTSIAIAYLSANLTAIVQLRVLDPARSRRHLLLYAVTFLLWGSVIWVAYKLMDLMRQWDNWAA